MRVALDASGPGAAALAAGAAEAAAAGLEVELHGPGDALRAELAKLGSPAALTVVEAAPAPGLEEDAAAACRERPDSGLMRAAESVAQRRADAFVTPAPPALAAAAALWHLKRLRGVLKPALALPLATPRGTTLLVDAGACLDCKPWHLLQFALMGSLHARLVGGATDPSVRLLAVGAGRLLGGELQRETLPLLKYAGVRFEGAVSPEDVFRGGADVVVSDGLCGAVLAGASLGLPPVGFEMLESDLAAGTLTRLARRLAEGAFGRARARSKGPGAAGAALLGVGGAAVVCSRGAQDVAEALLMAGRLAEAGLAAEISSRLEDMKSGMEFARTIE